MKYLKLDTRLEYARKLAECLIGNECKTDRHTKALLVAICGVYPIYEGFTSFGTAYQSENATILIPLDKIKPCPFMAMKNGIEIKSINLKKFGERHSADITSIGKKFGGFIISFGYAPYANHLEDFAFELYLEDIEREVINGVELVEV